MDADPADLSEIFSPDFGTLHERSPCSPPLRVPGDIRPHARALGRHVAGTQSLPVAAVQSRRLYHWLGAAAVC